MAIVLMETLHPEAHSLLTAYDEVVQIEHPADFETIQRTPHVEAILTRGRGQIRRQLMQGLTALRVVARCGVGLDNIDTDAAAELGIPIVYAPGSTTTAVAEHTLLLMLALARRLVSLDNAVKSGQWTIRNGYTGIELAGKTLGIIGMGAIGQRVAQLASAFGMSVCYWNRRPVEAPGKQVTLDELFQQSDVLSLHVALTPETQQLIGRDEMLRMKPGALLINTARGSIVDQAALQEALLSGHLGGYASDVLEIEPPVAHDPLVASERSLITPHIAALTDATYRLICVSTAANVLRLLRGEQTEPGTVYNGR
jgi:phosphoglycerate dehydrogenase-like enzyme